MKSSKDIRDTRLHNLEVPTLYCQRSVFYYIFTLRSHNPGAEIESLLSQKPGRRTFNPLICHSSIKLCYALFDNYTLNFYLSLCQFINVIYFLPLYQKLISFFLFNIDIFIVLNIHYSKAICDTIFMVSITLFDNSQ